MADKHNHAKCVCVSESQRAHLWHELKVLLNQWHKIKALLQLVVSTAKILHSIFGPAAPVLKKRRSLAFLNGSKKMSKRQTDKSWEPGILKSKCLRWHAVAVLGFSCLRIGNWSPWSWTDASGFSVDFFWVKVTLGQKIPPPPGESPPPISPPPAKFSPGGKIPPIMGRPGGGWRGTAFKVPQNVWELPYNH